MRHPLLIPDLRELIRDGELAGLRDYFAEHHPGRVAELIEDLEADEGDALFRVLPPRNRAEVLSYLEPARQVRLFEVMPAQEAAGCCTSCRTTSAPTWSTASTRT